jgi:hypothetical protein
MSFLPHDPSVYVDEQIIGELVVSFSDGLRASVSLRGALNDTVGNYWPQFEEALTCACRSVMLQEPLRQDLVEAVLDSLWRLSTADLVAIRDLFLDASLAVLPLHAAASVAELFDKSVAASSEVIEAEHSEESLHRARSILTGGHLFR